jgi:hypothetical protein
MMPSISQRSSESAGQHTRRAFLETFLYSAAGFTALGALPIRALGAPVHWEPPLQSLLLGEDPTPGLEPDELVEIKAGTSLDDPVLARTGDGSIWVAWMEMKGDDEQVLLSKYNPSDGSWMTPIVVNEGQTSSGLGTLAYQTQILALGPRILVAWAAREDGQCQIRARVCNPADNSLSRAVTIVSADVCWRPALAALRDGGLIAWEEKVGDHFAIRARNLDAEGRPVGDAFDLTQMPDRDCCRPALAVSPTSGELAFAFDTYDGDGTYNVHVGRTDFSPRNRARSRERTVQVTEHPATDIAPALAYSLDGKQLWIGWHSNRKGEAEWDIPRWYRLAAMDTDTDRLLQPTSPPRGMDLDMREPVQGWEFVRLVACPDGKICVLGRPSHNWNLQFYHGDEWSPIYRFPKDGWGGRGKLASALLDADGALWVTRRDLNANVLQRVGGVVGDEAREPVLVPLDEVTGRALTNVDPHPEFPPETDEAANRQYNFYFGDIHAHTWMSDGMGDVDEYFHRNRDVFHDDFAALTDHDNFVGQRLLNSQYEEHKAMVDHNHRDGQFVTLYAQEWTTGRPTSPHGYGHLIFYGVTPDHPMMDHRDERWQDESQVMAVAKQHGMMGAPHHIGWTGHRWEEHDPDVVRWVEVCSVHGAFEYMGNEPIPHRGGMEGMFVQDGLARGLKFGLSGGSDQHGLIWHHRVCWKRNAYRAGITGVLAPELTREAVFDALRNRRIFASTGVKMRMGFKVNGALMGSEITCEGPPKIDIDLIVPHDIRWVDLVRSNQNILRYGGESLQTFFSHTDEECPVGETVWYYPRVIFESGDMAWASPIWVTRSS